MFNASSFLGIAGTIWLVLWGIFSYETPAKHPWISEKERDYIELSLAAQVPPKVGEVSKRIST